MKRYLKPIATLGFASFLTTAAYAVPVLQIGAPAGAGDTGIYADYQKSLTDPTETDTAITSGGKLYVAGAYQKPVPNPLEKGTYDLLLGGQYSASQKNWSNFGFNTAFNSARAVLMATIPDGTLAKILSNTASVTVNGNSYFYKTGTMEDGFVIPNPPSNHDPVKDQDYLFFNIGDFASTGTVVNMADETSQVTGERKDLTISISGLDWVHFDVFALMTQVTYTEEKVTNSVLVGYKPNGSPIYKNISETTLVSSIIDAKDPSGNPGSHDTTWKDEGGGGGGGNPVPEPGTITLLGLGMAALGLFGWKRRR